MPTKQKEILTQRVIVPNILITELRDRDYAERLTREVGVRLHFDIPWCKMRYCRHYRDDLHLGEMWEFRSVPFKEK